MNSFLRFALSTFCPYDVWYSTCCHTFCTSQSCISTVPITNSFNVRHTFMSNGPLHLCASKNSRAISRFSVEDSIQSILIVAYLSTRFFHLRPTESRSVRFPRWIQLNLLVESWIPLLNQPSKTTSCRLTPCSPDSHKMGRQFACRNSSRSESNGNQWAKKWGVTREYHYLLASSSFQQQLSTFAR